MSSKNTSIFTLLFLILSFSLSAQISDLQTQLRIADEYYRQGETEKAREVYETLLKKPSNIPYVHTNYYNLLMGEAQYDEAKKYLKRAMNQYRGNLIYKIDYALVFKQSGESDKYTRELQDLKKYAQRSVNSLISLAQNFIRKGIPEEAVELYLEARKRDGNDYALALQLANVYRMTSQREAMIREYLNYALENPHRLGYVKNVLQSTLEEEEEFDELEYKLIELVQESPDEKIYSQLLIWVYLQRKDFENAFVQARAYDKRTNGEGFEILKIGSIAMKNEAYKDAIRIYDYIVETYPNSPNRIYASQLSIKAQEEIVKQTYPVNLEDIRKLADKYQALYQVAGNSKYGLEAQRSRAKLAAFYLDSLQLSIEILQSLISNTRATRQFIAECKIDLGDIYQLNGEPWESTLLYSQVEKTFEDSPLAYEAKLKNARLNYYNGDFELAKSHLDILKVATTREISNDAIYLSLLINDNTFLDTVEVPLKIYADAELLIYRNKDSLAISKLNELEEKYPEHNLRDEIYISKAKIYRKQGKFTKAVEMLTAIVDNYGDDILGDDAFYQLATIYEDHLNDPEKASEYYQEFLKKYPGSIYVSEARKRFRKLRGDVIN